MLVTAVLVSTGTNPAVVGFEKRAVCEWPARHSKPPSDAAQLSTVSCRGEPSLALARSLASTPGSISSYIHRVIVPRYGMVWYDGMDDGHGTVG